MEIDVYQVLYQIIILSGAILQAAVIWYYTFYFYPLTSGRSNYYVPLVLATAITSLCATTAITLKSKERAACLSALYTIMLILVVWLANSESVKGCALAYELFMLTASIALFYSSTSERAKKVLKDFLI